MSLVISKYAENYFEDENEVIKDNLPIAFDLNCEPWELHEILTHLYLTKSTWSNAMFNVDGFKNYDEDGNSYWVGVLTILAEGQNKQDFLELAHLWEEAENNWMNSFDYD